VGYTAVAIDADINDTVSYSIIDPSNKLTIDSINGVITTVAPIDYELETSINAIVTATSIDGSLSTQLISIIVQDVNDNAPIIVDNQTYTVAENLSSGSTVGTVQATDVDTATILQNWQIVSGNSSSAFSIDTNTGVLSVTTATELDFETTPQYTLGITVSDDAGNVSIAKDVIINVTDINEAPIITSQANAIALENNLFSFDITAIDSENDPLTISSSSALPAWLVLDSSTGNLSGIPSNADVGTYVLNFNADDGVNTASQVFTLMVTDTNQSPIITSAAPTTAIEDTNFSHLITANDPDNDSVTFSSTGLPAWLTLTDNGNGTATLQGSYPLLCFQMPFR